MSANATIDATLTDVHVHLQDAGFGASLDDVERLLKVSADAGVKRFVCPATSPADWNRVASIGRRFDSVYVMFGVHPWYVARARGDWKTPLKQFLDEYVSANGAKAALGEVGLDFATREAREDAAVRGMQETSLRAQLELADERALPVALHAVRANDRILAIMSEYKNVPAWLLHGWTATPEELDRAASLGAFFSFSVRSLSPQSKRALATVVASPRDRVLLESDGPGSVPPPGCDAPGRDVAAPYVRPLAEDGTPAQAPVAVLDVLRGIASARKTPLDDLARQIAVNEKRFFSRWSLREESGETKK